MSICVCAVSKDEWALNTAMTWDFHMNTWAIITFNLKGSPHLQDSSECFWICAELLWNRVKTSERKLTWIDIAWWTTNWAKQENGEAGLQTSWCPKLPQTNLTEKTGALLGFHCLWASNGAASLPCALFLMGSWRRQTGRIQLKSEVYFHLWSSTVKLSHSSWHLMSANIPRLIILRLLNVRITVERMIFISLITPPEGQMFTCT